jgi:hypothetical protein
MNDEHLIDGIITEMDRVWGKNGLEGKDEEYKWLFSNYGISEMDDVRWQLILQKSAGDLPKDHDYDEDVEMKNFLDDEAKIHEFLRWLLTQYRSSAKVYTASN